MKNAKIKLKFRTILFSLFLVVLIWPLGNTTLAEDIAIIVRDDFPLEKTTLYELKTIYMGTKTFQSGTKLKPVDQRDRNPIKELFLQKVLQLNPSDYEGFWAIRTFGGIIPPSIKKTSNEVIYSILGTEGALGYVWKDEADWDGIKILMTIPVEN